jgi:hypothetical protein
MRRRGNAELRRLFEADQRDRSGDIREVDWDQLRDRDRQRRRRVEALIAGGALRRGPHAEDYFHAAMVFQHGEGSDDIRRAYELASKAAELGMDRARWLAAAAYDRWLMTEGRPQKYGTQYQARDGRWVLYEVDPATTDDERAEWNVPPLAESLARAEQMTRERPPGPDPRP